MSKISAFVVTCDKDVEMLRAVIAATSQFDELIIVDKGRNPASLKFLFSNGMRYYREGWSATVEETRKVAVACCSHDWIVCLDDDEILSPACAEVFREFVARDGVNHLGDRIDVLQVPIRHYVLGRYDPQAYYREEHRPTLFRRGKIEFRNTVHAGSMITGNVQWLDYDGDAYITHLSHPDVASWIEKTNRYTSQPNRSGVASPPAEGLVEWAKAALGRYAVPGDGDPYRGAVAVLRGLYDVVDGLKRWEATQPDGHAAFAEIAKAEIKRKR